MSVLKHVLYYTLIQEVYTYCKSHNIWFITSPKDSLHLFDILLILTALKKLLKGF